MFNSCVQCFQRYGKSYTPDCDKICDYARAIKVLKEVLICNDGCTAHCKKSYHEKYVGMVCDHDKECINHSLYEIDYDKVIKDYGIKFDRKMEINNDYSGNCV